MHPHPPSRRSISLKPGQEGYKLYRIPGIVVTKQGTVLAYCEARKSDRGDWGPIDVLMRRSTDGGKTWLPRQKIVHVEGDLPINPVAAAQNLDKPGDNTVNNPVAIVDHETGAVHFLYCLEYMRCFYMRSDDDGVTWTEPVEITKTFDAFRSEYDWKVLATGPAHGIQLTTGRSKDDWSCRSGLSLGTGGHAHRPSVTATIYSDDHGQDVAARRHRRAGYAGVRLSERDRRRAACRRARDAELAQRIEAASAVGHDQSGRRHELVAAAIRRALLEPICMAGIVRVREPQGDQPGVIAFSNPHNLSRAGRQGDARQESRSQ